MVNRLDSGTAFVQAQGEKVLKTHVTEEAPKPEPAKVIPAADAEKMTDGINKFLETAKTDLRFQFHDELGEYYVSIVNSNTNEVIKEIPSKKLMDIQAAIRSHIGALLDRKI